MPGLAAAGGCAAASHGPGCPVIGRPGRRCLHWDPIPPERVHGVLPFGGLSAPCSRPSTASTTSARITSRWRTDGQKAAQRTGLLPARGRRSFEDRTVRSRPGQLHPQGGRPHRPSDAAAAPLRPGSRSALPRLGIEQRDTVASRLPRRCQRGRAHSAGGLSGRGSGAAPLPARCCGWRAGPGDAGEHGPRRSGQVGSSITRRRRSRWSPLSDRPACR